MAFSPLASMPRLAVGINAVFRATTVGADVRRLSFLEV